MFQWGLMRPELWNNGRARDEHGRMGRGSHWSGVFYHVGSGFDTREDYGSGAVGRAEGGVGSWIVTLLSERQSQPACQSGGAPNCGHVSQPSSGQKMRDGFFAELSEPQGGAGPAPKRFDGHDVSLRFSITHGFAHPVAAVAARATTIVMGQGWKGENFSWGARVHEPEVGCWTWCAGVCRTVSPSARPPPFPLPSCCLAGLVAGCAKLGKEDMAWRGVGMAGPLGTSTLLSVHPYCLV